MKYVKIFCTAVVALCAPKAIADPGQSPGGGKSIQPTLVVNIVVSGLRYDYIDRYHENLSENGFRYFMDTGMVFTESRYDFMQTNTPATLATLVTGANPSVHGVVGKYWHDYTTGKRISLIDDGNAKGLGCDMGICCYSAANLTVPTLGDALRKSNKNSKVVTVAADPFSAVSLGGMDGEAYWFDSSSGNWTSSDKYMSCLPAWALKYNESNGRNKGSLTGYIWTPSIGVDKYKNSRVCIMNMQGGKFGKIKKTGNTFGRQRYDEVLYTPLANELTSEFAKQVFIYEDLGKDCNIDILNVCFDATRNVSELYGHESVEAEDMFYRIDKTIASLIGFIRAQFRDDRVVFVLTSDHGMSDSYDNADTPKQRFNSLQFKTIINSYLEAQFKGDGNWVWDCYDRRLYLNRTKIYNSGLNLGEVQRRAADYALQFRGVANVVTSASMQTSSFGDDVMRRIQNGFYPKRSGDLIVNLAAGYIDEYEQGRAASGSLYNYDTHVPLMFAGCGIPRANIDRRVDMCSVAVTLARIMNISRPEASFAEPIGEILDVFK